MQQNIEIVKRIISTPEFKDYYINSNIRRTRNILSGFLTDAELDVIQDDLNDFVLTFDGKDRIRAIRLLYKHVINEKYKADFKQYVCKNWELLSEDDIFDFAFNVHGYASSSIFITALLPSKNFKPTFSSIVQ